MFTVSLHLVRSHSLPASYGQYTFTASPIWSVQVHCQSHLVSTGSLPVPSGQYFFTSSPHLVSTCSLSVPHMVSTHSMPVSSSQYYNIHIWSIKCHSHLVSAMTFTASSHMVSTRSLPIPSGQYTFTASPICSVQSWSLPVPNWSVHVQWQSPPVPMWSDRAIPSDQYSHVHCNPHLVSTVMFTAIPMWSVQSCSLQSPSG